MNSEVEKIYKLRILSYSTQERQRMRMNNFLLMKIFILYPTVLGRYNKMMTCEWDENKRLSNLQKHKIDFMGAEEIFDAYTISFEDEREGYGEQRFITFGLLQSRVVSVVHTERNENIRIISIRKATQQEARAYYAAITN